MTTDATAGYGYTPEPDPTPADTPVAEETPQAPEKKTKAKPRAKTPSRSKAPTAAQVRGVLDVVARVASADDGVVETARDLVGAEDNTALTVAIATGKAKVPDTVETIKRLRSDDADDKSMARIEVGATSAAELRELWTLVSTLDGSNDRLPNSAHIKIAIRTVEKIDALSSEQVARLDEVAELVNG